jgi:hypothetical protein
VVQHPAHRRALARGGEGGVGQREVRAPLDAHGKREEVALLKDAVGGFSGDTAFHEAFARSIRAGHLLQEDFHGPVDHAPGGGAVAEGLLARVLPGIGEGQGGKAGIAQGRERAQQVGVIVIDGLAERSVARLLAVAVGYLRITMADLFLGR